MHEKVNRWPIIALLAVSASALLLFSAMQSAQRKEKQQAKFDLAAMDQAKTEQVMKQIGEQADRDDYQANLSKDQQYARSAAGKEAKRLEDEDRRWLKEHPLSPPDPRSTEH